MEDIGSHLFLLLIALPILVPVTVWLLVKLLYAVTGDYQDVKKG